jgi:colanic acid biosynthesis glycosyl transferase WcaI
MLIRFFNLVEPVAPLYRDLLPRLAEAGFLIDVIISNGDYRPIRKPLEEAVRHPNIRISRVGITFTGKKGRIIRLVAMLSYAVGAILRSLLSQRADLNFFLTQPPLFSLWGYVLKCLRKEPYLCLVMDVYPDVAIKVGLIHEKSALAKFLNSVSIVILRNASTVIVIGRCMRERLVSKGIPVEKIQIIPNRVNTTDVYPIPHELNFLRQELNLGDNFVVLYSGNLGISHHFDDLLEIARRNRDVAGLIFVIIGNGARWDAISQFKQRERLDNLLLLPLQPLERLPESLSLGDIHFVSLKDGFEGLEVPSKAYGALAAGRPLIYQGNAAGEIAQMILEADIGYVVPQGDPDRLEQVIHEFLSNRERLIQQGERARKLGESAYSSETGVNKYLALLLEYQPKKE